MSLTIQRVLVVGAGWTGRQIAAQSASHGFTTYVTDANKSVLASVTALIDAYTREQLQAGIWSQDRMDALKKNLFVCNTPTDLQDLPDLVIESVSEQSSTKRKVLKEFSQRYSSPTIIASNSSYFLPSQLSRYVEEPSRFAHLHFHVPVAYATLVDIVPGPNCDELVVEQLQLFSESIGQTPLVQSVENPGYVFNWMLQSLLKSALELIDRNIATPEQIDLAWKTVTKMPLGPMGIIDRIGVDVVLQVLQNARWAEDSESLDRMISILEPLVQQGKLGWKSGAGFFNYSDEEKAS
jgi:3-hydroxybutyryl-CoA dehydrogenase